MAFDVKIRIPLNDELNHLRELRTQSKPVVPQWPKTEENESLARAYRALRSAGATLPQEARCLGVTPWYDEIEVLTEMLKRAKDAKKRRAKTDEELAKMPHHRTCNCGKCPRPTAGKPED